VLGGAVARRRGPVALVAPGAGTRTREAAEHSSLVACHGAAV
jgi:hypothetical protein